MYSTKLKLECEAAISAIAQVIEEHAENINAYLLQEIRDYLGLHPEVNVENGDKTLHDIDRESELDCLGWLEDALQDWLYDGQRITVRQYELVTGDYDAREGILWDFVSAFAGRTKYQDLLTSSESEKDVLA